MTKESDDKFLKELQLALKGLNSGKRLFRRGQIIIENMETLLTISIEARERANRAAQKISGLKKIDCT